MKKLLIISPVAFHNKIGEAGHKTLNFYASHFAKDFELTILTLADVRFNNFKLMLQDHPNINFIARYKPYNILERILNYILYNFIYQKLKLILPKYYVTNGIMQRRLKSILKDQINLNEFDFVLVEFTSMILHIDLLKKYLNKSKFIASCHDITFQAVDRWLKNTMWVLSKKKYAHDFRKIEKDALNKFDLIITQSNKDKHLLIYELGLYEGGIDVILPYYDKYTLSENNKNGIVFYGAMNRNENSQAVLWFLKNVWQPIVSKTNTKIVFYVVGGGASPTFKKYCSKYNNIICTGFVQNPANYFSQSYAMVIPLIQGAGIKVKAIECLACGLPLISNQIGIEGIQISKDVHYINCDSIDEWKHIIKTLVLNPNQYQTIGAAGKRFITENFDIEKSYINYKTRIEVIN